MGFQKHSATPHTHREVGYLAKSDANTGCEPQKFDKNTSVDDDTTLINDPDHNISDFSKTTRTRTLANSKVTQCLKPVFLTFLMMILLLRWKAKKACKQETVARQGERKGKENVLCSLLQSRFPRKVIELCEFELEESQKIQFRRVSENAILMDEISWNIVNEELNKHSLRNIQFRKNHTRLSKT